MLDPRRYAGAARALERVLSELKRRNPRMLLLLNGGLPLAERARAASSTGWRSSRCGPTTTSRRRAYRVRPAEEAEARAALLGRVAALGLPVFTLEYAPGGGGPGPADLIRRARARGFVPYVSTIGLDQVSTHTLRPVTRAISRRALLGGSVAAAGARALERAARPRPPARRRPLPGSCRAACSRSTSRPSSTTT